MQVIRIATFETKPDVPDDRYAAFLAWMSSQPGLRSQYHVHEPGTSRYLSISVWDSREQLMALRERVPPGGPLGIKPSGVAIYDVESSGGPSA